MCESFARLPLVEINSFLSLVCHKPEDSCRLFFSFQRNINYSCTLCVSVNGTHQLPLARAHTHTHKHTHTHTQTHTHTPKHTHIHTHTQTHTHTIKHTHTPHTYTFIHTHIHSNTHTHIHSNTNNTHIH
jgi:hypothetical protein